MKSFIDTMRVDQAKRAHNCQHNTRHRITMGEARLCVKVEMSEEKFCKACAVKFLGNDIEKIKGLIEKLEASD